MDLIDGAVWRCVATRPGVVELPSLPEKCSFAVKFASLDDALAKRRPRGRWRSSMIRTQGLRWIRTTMLGRTPVFAGMPAPVGPWRRVALLMPVCPASSTVACIPCSTVTTGSWSWMRRCPVSRSVLGLGTVRIAALDEWLPEVVAAEAPGTVWVSSSPSAPPGSSVPPTHVGSGIAHYFGVGGYRRRVIRCGGSSALTAPVRFVPSS